MGFIFPTLIVWYPEPVVALFLLGHSHDRIGFGQICRGDYGILGISGFMG